MKNPKDAIDNLVNKAQNEKCESTDALRFSQAALNLAHAYATIKNIDK